MAGFLKKKKKKRWQACKDRTRKCSETHGEEEEEEEEKKPFVSTSPPPPSAAGPSHSKPPCFFKIMLGDFRKVLFIPPKFAKLLDGIVNQNVLLEDSNGNTTTVQVSAVDGSLAFQQGWSDFVLDHQIKHGELVVFKYTRKSLFSVQIFGITACERLHFDEINNKNVHKKKRDEAEFWAEIMQLPKKRKSFEAVKDEGYTHSEDTEQELETKEEKKDLEMKDDSCDLTDVEIAETICAPEESTEVKDKPEQSPLHCNSPKSSKFNQTVINHEYTEKQHLQADSSLADNLEINHEVQNGSTHYQEVEEVCDMGKFDCNTECYTGHLEKLFTHGEAKISRHEDRCDTGPANESQYFEMQNQIASNWAIVTYDPWSYYLHELSRCEKRLIEEWGMQKMEIFNAYDYQSHWNNWWKLDVPEEVGLKFLLTEEGICHIVDPTNLLAIGNNTNICFNDDFSKHREANSKCEDVPEVSQWKQYQHMLHWNKGWKLDAPEEVGVKFLLTEEGICHIVDTTNLLADGNNANICFNDDFSKHREANSKCDDVPEFSQCGDIPDSVQDGKGNLVLVSISIGSTSESTLAKDDFLLTETVASPLLDMPDAESTEGNACLSDTLPDLPNLNEKENKPSFKVQTLKAMKVEKIDSDEKFPSEPSCFSLTLPSNHQSFLELPKKLPCIKKRQLERKVVILRDPSMRSWPLLYHESFKFRGFVAGWKAFATANNLQEGNVCKFFQVANEIEATFQVQVSQV